MQCHCLFAKSVTNFGNCWLNYWFQVPIVVPIHTAIADTYRCYLTQSYGLSFYSRIHTTCHSFIVFTLWGLSFFLFLNVEVKLYMESVWNVCTFNFFPCCFLGTFGHWFGWYDKNWNLKWNSCYFFDLYWHIQFDLVLIWTLLVHTFSS